jgi:hypothetical protein
LMRVRASLLAAVGKFRRSRVSSWSWRNVMG